MPPYPTALLSDAAGQRVVLPSAIGPLWPQALLAGPAFTVRVKPGELRAVLEAALGAAAGDVVVVDGGGETEWALWGDILARVALARGLAGLVVDGAVRDAGEIERLGFPVFARAVTPSGPRDKERPGEHGVALTLGDVPIEPGDLVYGDRDGVVVIPQARHADVLAAAAVREAAETELLQSLLSEGR